MYLLYPRETTESEITQGVYYDTRLSVDQPVSALRVPRTQTNGRDVHVCQIPQLYHDVTIHWAPPHCDGGVLPADPETHHAAGIQYMWKCDARAPVLGLDTDLPVPFGAKNHSV